MIGRTLGHYRVVQELGRGGMGEVYTADDLNLNRKVALKFLPDAFAGDPERMARFEREAKLLASLNHPNIAAVYGLEQAEGKRFIVMELVEGETLAQRISKGALPIEDALAICRQIAEGLEAAHEKGVIHRDLKPANVMITEGDKVKILDFGLAKALSDETQSIDSSQSPTLTEAMTRPGVILGTAAYMSPEQAKGKSVDKRADIWAFGCMLYECLTGKKPFEGETVTETLASVLTKEAELEAIPATVRPLLQRCLEKDPRNRLRDIGDAFALLAGPQNAPPVKRSRLLFAWAAIATLLLIAAAIPAFLHFRGGGPAAAMRLEVTVPPMPPDYGMVISPNGRWIALTAFSSGSVHLFVRDIAAGTTTRIERTAGAKYPFWSPDSRSIGFSAGTKLKRVDVSGKLQQDICSLDNFGGGTWNRDGIIIFSDWPILRRVSAEGGESIAVTTLDEGRKEILHYFPCFLPDGSNFLYVIGTGSLTDLDIYLGSLNSKRKTLLFAGVSMAVYAEPGYLLFQRERTLFAQAFDAKKLILSGEPIAIGDALIGGNWGSAAFGAAQNGLLIYRTGEIQPESQFVWLDRTGKQLGLAGKPGFYGGGCALSPDAKQIAVSSADRLTKSTDIWLIEWERNRATRLTNEPFFHGPAVWSPDGSRIGFTSSGKGGYDIYAKKASGLGETTPLVTSSEQEWIKDWSKDGRYIAYNSETGIYALPLFGNREPIPIARCNAWRKPGLNMPNFSYDGKWIAYNSDETGTWQVYVVPFPAANRKLLISDNGGVQPRWRRDGKELYYLTTDGKMMAVDIRSGEDIEASVPRKLFDTGFAVDPTNNQYDVTADGNRFLILTSLSEPNANPVTVVTNWTSLLKK